MQKNKGFTLVELLVVIAIIGILVMMVIVVVNPVRIIEDTRDTRNRAEMLQIKNALQLYLNDNNQYPIGAEFGTGGAVPLIPDYARELPNVITETNFFYGAAGTDYDAVVDMNNTTVEDDATVTRCNADGDQSNGLTGDSFMICPD